MKLNMLPLMYLLEIADIMFAVSSVKSPGVHFDIHNYITFSSSNTRSSSQFKLNHRLTNNNLTRHSYFYRLPRLWNSLPSINSSLSMRTIKSLITSHLFTHFTLTFDSDYPCSFHYPLMLRHIVCACRSNPAFFCKANIFVATNSSQVACKLEEATKSYVSCVTCMTTCVYPVSLEIYLPQLTASLHASDRLDGVVGEV